MPRCEEVDQRAQVALGRRPPAAGRRARAGRWCATRDGGPGAPRSGRWCSAQKGRSGQAAVEDEQANPREQAARRPEPRVRHGVHDVAAHAGDGADDAERSRAGRRATSSETGGTPLWPARRPARRAASVSWSSTASASCPGGSAPRASSAATQARGRPPPAAPAAHGRRSPIARARRARRGWRRRSPGSCRGARCRAARAGRPAPGGAGTARAGRARWDLATAGSSGRAEERRGVRGAGQRRPGAGQVERVEAPRAGPAPARRARSSAASKGCSGCCDARWRRAARPSAVRTVWSTTSSSSPTGTAGGRWQVGALVAARVGDHEVVARRQQGVEEQLAIFAAHVAVADPLVARPSGRRRRARCGAGSCRRPGRAGTPPGAGMERIGTSVHTVRWPVQKLARVGRPLQAVGQDRAHVVAAEGDRADRPAFRGLADQVVEERRQLRALPGVGRASSPSGSRRCAARVSAQASTGTVAGEGVERSSEAIEELGQAAGQLDVAAVDVVERERLAEEPLAAPRPWPPREGSGPVPPARCWPRCPRAGTRPGARRRSPSARTRR